jgi:hypothetical protein
VTRPDEIPGAARPGRTRPDPDRSSRPESDEPPPFLGSWGRLYAAVLGWLAVLIVLFYIITVSFS